MSVLFIMVPAALLLAGGALAGFLWCVHRGQYDDLDTPAMKVLFEDADDRLEAERSSRRGDASDKRA
jgi:cbb3-type cytochrome oxidase maturation protein